MQSSGRTGRGKPSIRLARRLRNSETSAEELLWRELRNRRLDGLRFRRQMPVAGHIVDFACVAARLTVEVDGKRHADQVERGVERRRKIEAAGYLEIRFTNEDALRPAWVIEEIRRALDMARGRQMRPPALRLD